MDYKDAKASLNKFIPTVTEELNKLIQEMKDTYESLQTNLNINHDEGKALEQEITQQEFEINNLKGVPKSKSKISKKKKDLESIKKKLKSSQNLVNNLEEKINKMQKNWKLIESLEKQIRGEQSEKCELIKNMNDFSTQISNLQSLLISNFKPENVSESQQNLKIHVKQLTLELKQEKSKTSQERWEAKINEFVTKIDSLFMQLSKAISGKVAITVSTADDNRYIVINEKSQEKREKMDDLEEQIEELMVANCNLEKQLESFQKTIELEQRLDKFQTTYKDIEIEYTDFKKALHSKINELEKERNVNNYKIKQITESNEEESMWKKGLARKSQFTQEAKDNYQQLPLNHSQKSEAAKTLQKCQTEERQMSVSLAETLLIRDQSKPDSMVKELSCKVQIFLLQNEIDEHNNTLNNAENIKNQLENDLYRLKNSVLEENIIPLNNALEDKRNFKLMEAETSTHHSEVNGKLKTVEMLNESNVMFKKYLKRMKDQLCEKTSLREMLETLKIELSSKNNKIENLKLEEKFRNLSTSFEEMQQTISSKTQSLKEAENELKELRKMNDNNIILDQKKQAIISRLKTKCANYKEEKKSLTSELTKITEIKETLERELDGIRKELTSSKTKLHESSIASTPKRMKRHFNDIVDNNNVTTENSIAKQIRLRNPECRSQTLTDEEQIIEPKVQHITSEERQDLEMIDVEEEESDDEPECIELRSSDENAKDDNRDEEDSYNLKDENEDNVSKVDENVSQQQQHESDMMAEAKKIEAITCTDTSDQSGSMSLSSTSSMQPRRGGGFSK